MYYKNSNTCKGMSTCHVIIHHKNKTSVTKYKFIRNVTGNKLHCSSTSYKIPRSLPRLKYDCILRKLHLHVLLCIPLAEARGFSRIQDKRSLCVITR